MEEKEHENLNCILVLHKIYHKRPRRRTVHDIHRDNSEVIGMENSNKYYR